MPGNRRRRHPVTAGSGCVFNRPYVLRYFREFQTGPQRLSTDILLLRPLLSITGGVWVAPIEHPMDGCLSSPLAPQELQGIQNLRYLSTGLPATIAFSVEGSLPKGAHPAREPRSDPVFSRGFGARGGVRPSTLRVNREPWCPSRSMNFFPRSSDPTHGITRIYWKRSRKYRLRKIFSNLR